MHKILNKILGTVIATIFNASTAIGFLVILGAVVETLGYQSVVIVETIVKIAGFSLLFLISAKLWDMGAGTTTEKKKEEELSK